MPAVFRIHLAYARPRTNMPRKHIEQTITHHVLHNFSSCYCCLLVKFVWCVAGLAVHCLPNEWIGLRWFGNVTVANSRRSRRRRQHQRSAHLSLSRAPTNTSMVRRACPRMRYSPRQAIFRVVSQAFRVFVKRKRYSVVLCTPSVAASSHWICVKRACDFCFSSLVESNDVLVCDYHYSSLKNCLPFAVSNTCSQFSSISVSSQFFRSIFRCSDRVRIVELRSPKVKVIAIRIVLAESVLCVSDGERPKRDELKSFRKIKFNSVFGI